MSAEDFDDTAPRKGTNAFFKPGTKPEEVTAWYNDNSEDYEKMLASNAYRGPSIAVEEILRRVPPEKRSETRVLDVAAGTGKVGRKLHREGFRHIDGVDPSENMIRKLRESGVYTRDFVEFIGAGNSSVPEDTYDLVVISGGMGEGHIPLSGLDDLVRVAKKGGLVIIVMRMEYMETVAAYKDKLEPYMEELEQKGAWKKVDRRVVSKYSVGKDGVVFVFCVT